MACCGISAGGRFIAAAYLKTVSLYCICKEGDRVVLTKSTEVTRKGGNVTCLAWSSDGICVAIGADDGTVQLLRYLRNVWETSELPLQPVRQPLPRGRGSWHLTLPNSVGERAKKAAARRAPAIVAVTWDCSDKAVVAAASDGSLLTWSLASGLPELIRLEGHKDGIVTLEPHPTLPAVFLSCGNDGLAKVWHLPRRRALSIVSFRAEDQRVVTGSRWSPDGAKFIVTDSLGYLSICGPHDLETDRAEDSARAICRLQWKLLLEKDKHGDAYDQLLAALIVAMVGSA